mmetsp:Transcript_341/g.990  ORF Transcript_341/g.990 Transcript_341/m.990 type:complete len:224 (+) Transcript_341:767-1438(+)
MPKTTPLTLNCLATSHARLKSSHSSISCPFNSMMRSPTSHPCFCIFLSMFAITTPRWSSSASSNPSPRVPSGNASSIVILTFGFSLTSLARRLFFRFARKSLCTGVSVLTSASHKPSGSSSSSSSAAAVFSASLSSSSSNSCAPRSSRTMGSTSFVSLNIFRKGFSSSLVQISLQHWMPSCHLVDEATTAKAFFWSRVLSSCQRSNSSNTVSSISRMNAAATS